MKSLLTVPLLLAATTIGFGQNAFTAIIGDAETKEPLAGAIAIVEGTTIGATADENGFVEIKSIPNGKRTIVFSIIGYERLEREFVFPLASEKLVGIVLHRREKELEEVVVLTMRTSRSIADEPTRMEAIAGEELNEKSNMKPGDIRMLLNESTGIQTQQTSATTANASIRIQGLDGRFTQILRDGFPLYAGFAGGLSIMQIPPLDLYQVEIIKGSASTLYGSGAIAGIVNLISKTPSEKPELAVLVNATSAGGLDLSGFYSERFEKIGLAMFASRNSNAPYDPANIGLTAIPKFERYTFNPRLFLSLTGQSSLNLGVNTGFESRLGGDIHFVRDGGDSMYFEQNKSVRVSTQAQYEYKLTDRSAMSIKNSINAFSRALEIPQQKFDGRQFSSFSEASYAFGNEGSEWIAGLNLWTDSFNETGQDNFVARDYSQAIAGGFMQNTLDANAWLTLETGVRIDVAQSYGMFALPRVSALMRISPNLTSRIGGGLGYRLPTIFTEEAEAIQFRNVLPIDESKTEAERSLGGNIDVNYRTTLFDEIAVSVNQLFYYTRLDRPLVLAPEGMNLKFVNANGYSDTRGIETNLKLGYDNLKLFVGYTLTDARRRFNGVPTVVPLTPKHRLNTVLMYEVHDHWRAGLEAYYFSRQELNDGRTGKSYWICGFMAEKVWEKFSFYINFENLLDIRQTRFDTIYTGSITRPQFRDIYAPVDGFVVNGGVKLRL